MFVVAIPVDDVLSPAALAASLFRYWLWFWLVAIGILKHCVRLIVPITMIATGQMPSPVKNESLAVSGSQRIFKLDNRVHITGVSLDM